MARSTLKKGKAESVKAKKDQKDDAEKSPAKHGGKPPKSPKTTKDAVKKTAMKAKTKAGGAKSSKDVSKHPPTSEMVHDALTVLKNRKGLTLAAIRNHIATKYKCKVNKSLQNHIRNYLTKEFEAGRIQMVGAEDDEEIKFTNRFALVK